MKAQVNFDSFSYNKGDINMAIIRQDYGSIGGGYKKHTC